MYIHISKKKKKKLTSLEITSQIPSQATIRNSSPSDRSMLCVSGAGETLHSSTFMSSSLYWKSPRARDCLQPRRANARAGAGPGDGDEEGLSEGRDMGARKERASISSYSHYVSMSVSKNSMYVHRRRQEEGGAGYPRDLFFFFRNVYHVTHMIQPMQLSTACTYIWRATIIYMSQTGTPMPARRAARGVRVTQLQCTYSCFALWRVGQREAVYLVT